jgi:hypothetical protein
MTQDVECPYCEEWQEINHDDGQGYEEGVTHQQQCIHCDKIFTFTTSIVFYYEAEKADCLNGGEHIWKTTHTFPKFFTKMRCQGCDEERNPTKDERLKYNIPLTYNENQ